MAHVGNGLPFIATSQSEAKIMAEKFRNYVSNPLLTNIKIDFNGFDVYDVEPLEVPDIFSDRPVMVYGKYRGPADGFIEIKGENGGLGIDQRLIVANYNPEIQNSGIRSLWAREKIRMLDDYTNLAQNEEHADEMTALGLKYNLLTSYTSFIAIDSEARNENGTFTTVNQPLPLPKGVSNYAIGRATNAAGFQVQKSGLFSVSMDECMEIVTEERYEENGEAAVYNIEIKPEYFGGYDSLMTFLQQNLIYPEEARKQKIVGTVYIEFFVKQDGSLDQFVVKRGVNTLLENEAIRLIKLTNGNWNSGIQNGKKAKSLMIVPVKFQL